MKDGIRGDDCETVTQKVRKGGAPARGERKGHSEYLRRIKRKVQAEPVRKRTESDCLISNPKKMGSIRARIFKRPGGNFDLSSHR